MVVAALTGAQSCKKMFPLKEYLLFPEATILLFIPVVPRAHLYMAHYKPVARGVFSVPTASADQTTSLATSRHVTSTQSQTVFYHKVVTIVVRIVTEKEPFEIREKDWAVKKSVQ